MGYSRQGGPEAGAGNGRGGVRTPLAEPQFRAPQFRERGAAGGVSLTLSQLLPAWSSPQAHLRKAVRNARGNPRSPKCGPLAREEPRQPRAAAEPSPNSPPRHDSPHVLWPELRQRKGGSTHVGPAVKDYVPGGPPLQKKKKRERAQGRREGEPRGARAPEPRTRAHVCPCLADVAPPAQDFPRRADIFRVRGPEWEGSGSPQGLRGEPQPAGTPERGPGTKQCCQASQPPPPALTYLLHLVMVELRKEVGEQMRGDHPAAARQRRDGKPRLERLRGRRAARSDRFVRAWRPGWER